MLSEPILEGVCDSALKGHSYGLLKMSVLQNKHYVAGVASYASLEPFVYGDLEVNNDGNSPWRSA